MAKRKELPRYPVPDDYQPKQQTLDKLYDMYGEMDYADETDKFIDYHQANGSLLAIFDAAFRTWIRHKVRYESNQKSTGLSGQTNQSRSNTNRPSYFHKIANRIRH